VTFSNRLILFLCVFAGMSVSMLHGYSHFATDECVSHCDAKHGDTRDRDPADGDNHDSIPHHHECCHFPSADRVLDMTSAAVFFHSILMGITVDGTPKHDEPVFALDKPPLI
jgi:hypothetical protein